MRTPFRSTGDRAKPELGQFAFFNNQWRRQDDQVTAAAKDTPCVSAFFKGLSVVAALAARARVARADRVTDQFDHSEQSMTTPDIADDAMSLLELFQLDQHCTTQTARTLDQFFIFIGAHRGQSSGACQGMATVSQAGEENLSFQLPGDISGRSTAPSGKCAPVSPFASVIRSGLPASPYRCQANHSPQRPKPLITSSAIRKTLAERVNSRKPGQ